MHSEQDQQFQDWVGKQQTAQDILTVAPMEGLAATLDRENTAFAAGDKLPALWHWLYFPDPARQSALADDGHPQRGDFLPPIPLPRRMWAGSRLQFRRSLLVGEQVTRVSKIKSISMKQGRSGRLAFVCVSHTISGSAGVALEEEHDIVYREMASDQPVATETPKAEEKADFTKTISPDPVLLFRYSALTFNGHRIHYDRSYAQDKEYYPGLVVHGPLLATLLLELFTEHYPDAQLTQFEFKALSPVFDINDFQCGGNRLDNNGVSRLWIADSNGNLCLQARAEVVKTR
ncbi:MAG: MaoC family dehydratase N-terminal domain-containing protein [Pseudohongiellaceae bacterium]